jgi:hypothetical protein
MGHKAKELIIFKDMDFGLLTWRGTILQAADLSEHNKHIFVLGFLSLFTGIMAVVFTRQLLHFRKKYMTAEGIVTSTRIQNSAGDTSEYPTVSFKTITGQRIQCECPIGFSMGVFPAGKEVTVFYLPDDPQDFTLGNFSEKYWAVAVCTVAFIPCFIQLMIKLS